MEVVVSRSLSFGGSSATMYEFADTFGNEGTAIILVSGLTLMTCIGMVYCMLACSLSFLSFLRKYKHKFEIADPMAGEIDLLPPDSPHKAI